MPAAQPSIARIREHIESCYPTCSIDLAGDFLRQDTFNRVIHGQQSNKLNKIANIGESLENDIVLDPDWIAVHGEDLFQSFRFLLDELITAGAELEFYLREAVYDDGVYDPSDPEPLQSIPLQELDNLLRWARIRTMVWSLPSIHPIQWTAFLQDDTILYAIYFEAQRFDFQANSKKILPNFEESAAVLTCFTAGDRFYVSSHDFDALAKFAKTCRKHLEENGMIKS